MIDVANSSDDGEQSTIRFKIRLCLCGKKALKRILEIAKHLNKLFTLVTSESFLVDRRMNRRVMSHLRVQAQHSKSLQFSLNILNG